MKLFWTKFYILFCCSLISRCCPFVSYNEALIPDGMNLVTEEYFVDIKQELGNSFGFGLWILPTAFVGQSRSSQDLFQVKNQKNELYFQGKLNDFQTSQITFYLYYSSGSYFPLYWYYDFQNHWIFILYIVIPSQKRVVVQTTGQTPMYQYFEKEINQQTLIFQLGNFQQNFNFQFSELCIIPKPVDEPQTIYILQGLILFEKDKMISTSLDEYGTRYILSGWVKYNYDFVAYQTLYSFVRLSANELKQQQKIFGDDLFKLEVSISNSNLQINKIKITIDSYCIYGLSPGCKISQINAIDRYNEFTYNDILSYKYQEGLLQWHFFQYEYGRKNYQLELMLFHVLFYNSIGHITQKIGNLQRFSFADSKFYIFVGENDLNYNLLSASIYDLKFYFFYDKDQDFIISCHPTCKDCSGPLNINCLSFEIQTCECQTGYYQYEDEVICRLYEDTFPKVFSVSNEITQTQICQLGYFYYPYLDGEPKCLQCPQYQLNQFNCIDCLYNQTTWYLQPVCKYDLKQRGKSLDEVYQKTIRNSFDIDLYIIDEIFNLVLITGCESFCNPQDSKMCNQLNKTYLGQQITVQCKNGFDYQQNACVKQQISEIKHSENKILNCSIGSYLLENYCYSCPNYCLNCIYDQIKKIVSCLNCLTGYAIQNNSCVKCGINCKYCKVFTNSTSQTTQLLCVKCIDDSQYFISVTQTNCLKNEISGCQYALQRNKQDFLFFSNDLSIMTVCAYCNPLQVYDFQSNICQQDFFPYTEQNICLKKYLGSVGVPCYLSASNLYSNSFFLNCSTYVSYCNQCQRKLDLLSYICIQCVPGFYANRLSGICQLCPQELENCEQCGQQQILSQDYWIFNARAFIRQYMEMTNVYEFSKNGQSQNASDYEDMLCTTINVFNFVLKNAKNAYQIMIFMNVLNVHQQQEGECSPSSTMSVLNVQNIVHFAEFEVIKKFLRLINYFRTKISLNLHINVQKVTRMIYIIMTHIQVSIRINKIFKIFINLNLYCNQTKYQLNLNNCQNDNELYQFLSQNIYYEDLFSNRSFYYFENYDFYLKANIKIIKAITIHLSNSEPLFCEIESEAQISQKFGESIFSVLNVSLLLNFTESVIFKLQGGLNFSNFNTIYFRGIHFTSSMMSSKNIIKFFSVYPQEIKLFQTIFETNSSQQQIIIENLKNLQIDQLSVLNTNLINSNRFIQIVQNNFDKLIQIRDFTISKSSFKDSSIFEFNLGQNDQVSISNCKINDANFSNSSFLVIWNRLLQNSQQVNGLLSIDQISFVGIYVSNTKYFIDIEGLISCQISDFTLKQSKLFSSQFLNSCLKFRYQNLNFQNLKLFYGSILIMNSKLLQGQMDYSFDNAIFQNIEYDEVSHFIKLQMFDSQDQTLKLSNLTLLNNNCLQVTLILPQILRCQIYLNLNHIYFERLFIQKNYGIPEISIFSSQKIVQILPPFNKNHYSMLQVYIGTLIKSYPETIMIFSSIKIIISNFTIFGTSSLNSPFLLIKSAEQEQVIQQEQISIYNFQADKNLLIQSDGQKQLSLILVKSSQKVQIILQNTRFQNNILHQFQQNNLKSSSTLINIDCEQSDFSLLDSYFINNTVINGTDSIIYVNGREVILEKNYFYQNSIFQYSLLQPYLFWEFYNQTEVFIENIELEFPIKSLSGNAWLIGEIINITKNFIIKSIGKEGGGFRIQGKNISIISIQNLKLESLKTLFQSKEEYGGALYIDGYNSQQIKIIINYIQANQIFCKNQGGLIYIHLENIFSEVQISNINFSQVFASQGSLLYCEFFQKASHSQTISFNNIQGQNSYEGLSDYISSFIDIDIEDIGILTQNKSLMYIFSGQGILITQFLIFNSIFESLLIYHNALKVTLHQVSFLSSTISNCVIFIDFVETQQSYLTLSQSTFSNLTISKPNSTLCNRRVNIIPEQQFFCSKIFKLAPLNLNSYPNNSSIQSILGCVLNNLSQSPIGFIILSGLTDLTQITIKNSKFQFINCQLCLNGLIFFNYQVMPSKSNSIILNQIYIYSSYCGKISCIYVHTTFSPKRNLQNNSNSIQQFQLSIQKYQCQFNFAQKGTCLNIENINTFLCNSLFKENNAAENGGSIQVLGKNQFFISRSTIENNRAQIGGGAFLVEQFAIKFSQLKTILINNNAEQYGSNFASIPQQLSIIMNSSNIPMETILIEQSQNLQIDQVSSNNIFLPSGQAIGSYFQYFSYNRSSKYINLSISIVALQQDNTQTKSLANSYCQIFSRLYRGSEDENQEFTNNLTNLNITYFDSMTQNYKLNDLIIYYGNTDFADQVIQLQFQCNSIQVPNYNPIFPYNVISSHSNYKLRLNVKTFPCQLGEIQNSTFKFCQQCDSSLGFFSLKLNQYKCDLKDEITTSDVKPAELKLRAGYWRPYFDTDIISQCLNLLMNCNGGWIEGDSSCLLGHLGALCEQCDIENVRGAGKYSENDKFYCSECSKNYSNILTIVIITTWTLLSLYIAVNGNVQIQLEFTKLSPFTRYRLARNLNKTQSGALIKILTNYFQIIASITTFHLYFPKIFISTTNTFGTPILTMVQSQDCFLNEMFHLEIHYSRVIWLLFLELAYIFLFSFLFYLGKICKLIMQFQTVFITTLLYVYIYFQPDLVWSLISLISYREISGFNWIQANLAYRYDTNRHFEWIIKFCLPLLFIFSLLIPSILFIHLFQYRYHLENRQIRMKYGYLYHEYKNNAYFWEIVKIVEKELIIFFLRFYEDEIVLKGVFILSISYLYSLLNNYYRPYYLNNLNSIDNFSANICQISFAFSIGAYVSQQITQTKIEIAFLIFVISLNFFFAVYLLSKIINEYIRNFNCNFVKVQIFLRTKVPFLMNFKFLRKILISHASRKKRLTYLLMIFKQRALALAKGSIFAKRMISQTWRASLDSNGQLDSLSNFQENISQKRRSLLYCSLDSSVQIKHKESERRLK